MRLINVSTLQLEYFIDQEHAPSYAILSHTWGEGEVSTQDFMSPDRAATEKLRGFPKIHLTCRQAQLDELTHAWVDTCCIDKTSSAELTEAINSMYEWYQKSTVCYGFLEDLGADDPVVEEAGSGAEGKSLRPSAAFLKRPSASLLKSRWFTRGWTLQELIAPKTLRFYDQTWSLRGTKASLSFTISTITGIEEPVLQGNIDIDTLPIARRMAWAAHRVTTRIEDIAYCLLGIFNVSMPMLYGEREKAFTRLQEEIMRDSNDTSLFAWRAPPNSQSFRGILATSPSEFREAAKLEHSSDARFDTEFSITNKGIRMSTNLWIADGKPIFPLKCRLGGKALAIHLHQHGAGVYARTRPELLLAQSDDEKNWKTQGVTSTYALINPIWISKSVSPGVSLSLGGAHRNGIHLRQGFSFRDDLSAKAGSSNQGESKARITWVHSAESWDSSRELFLTRGGEDFTGVVMASEGDLQLAMIIVGIKDRQPWVTFFDLASDGHLMVDKSKMWDLEHLKHAGLQLLNPRFKDFRLEITKAEVDGEAVYCVDLTQGPPQMETFDREGTGRLGLQEGRKFNRAGISNHGHERKRSL